MLNVINAVLGGSLLLAGRKVFWLFVGVVGFAAGAQAATRFFHGPEWLAIAVGLGLGLIFAMLAVFLQTVAIGIAGFLGGGYILLGLAGLFGLDHGFIAWAAFLIGGIIGAALIASLFDWALIFISSIAGALMVMDVLHLSRLPAALVFLGLLGVGIAVQASALHAERRGHPHHD